jgi:glycosyltransferase involved in cell wall biosynthesis
MRYKNMKISIVIPALNEEAGIESVIHQITAAGLREAGFETEIIIVDNGSEDRTAEIARECGATVVSEKKRGYGNAYKAGLSKASGDIIVTGDADMTYPFDHTPELVRYLLDHDLDFLSTNRLATPCSGIEACIHALGTFFLTVMMKAFFRCPFRDSQSGMWILRREVWDGISVKSDGMPFSQEIKIEAFLSGYRCAEVPIEYRPRIGQSKLHAMNDGWAAVNHLVARRLSKKKLEKDKKIIF